MVPVDLKLRKEEEAGGKKKFRSYQYVNGNWSYENGCSQPRERVYSRSYKLKLDLSAICWSSFKKRPKVKQVHNNWVGRRSKKQNKTKQNNWENNREMEENQVAIQQLFPFLLTERVLDIVMAWEGRQTFSVAQWLSCGCFKPDVTISCHSAWRLGQ